MSYDFTTLSPDDFENLVADLLSHEWGIRLESFKPGKDSGIDLRNTRVLAGTPTTIFQCKRYASQKFAELNRNINAKQGFREFQAARRTIQGYEAVHMVRKGLVRWLAGDDLLRQIQFIDTLFDSAA